MSSKSLSERLSDQAKNTAAATVKSSFGKTLEEISIKEAMAFMSTGLGNDNPSFLVAGLYYTANRAGITYENTVPFERKLASFYWTQTQTTKGKIEDLINSEFDKEGVFASKFKRICKQMIAANIGLNNVDYDKLCKDLRRWDYEGNYTKLNWAKSIFNPTKPEDESNSDDNQEDTSSDS